MVVVGFRRLSFHVLLEGGEAVLEVFDFLGLLRRGVMPILLGSLVVFKADIKAFADGCMDVVDMLVESGVSYSFYEDCGLASIFRVGGNGRAPLGEQFLCHVKCKDFSVVGVGGGGCDAFTESNGTGKEGYCIIVLS